jgi:hypothetical protein
VTYSFCTRDRVSAIAREGLGDSLEQLRTETQTRQWTKLSCLFFRKKV